MERMMTTQELICKYIVDHPGCIKEMYYEEDQADVDETSLLNPDDWKVLDYNTGDETTEEAWFETDYGIESDSCDLINQTTKWCDGIIFHVSRHGKLLFENQPKSFVGKFLDDDREIDIEED